MTVLTYDKEVVGDLHAAYALLRDMRDDGAETKHNPAIPSPPPVSDENRERLLQGIGTIICIYMRLFDPDGPLRFRQDEFPPPADALHLVVSAVVAKITQALPGAPEAIPLINGALISAAQGENCYEWRVSQGPWDTGGMMAWIFAAWFLADLIDFAAIDIGLHGKGYALDVIAAIIDRPKRKSRRRRAGGSTGRRRRR